VQNTFDLRNWALRTRAQNAVQTLNTKTNMTTKILNIGQTQRYGTLWAKIKWDGRKLSIAGVEGDSYGQIITHEWDFVSYAPGWSAELVATFRSVWDRWHLNDMRAGSPAQEAFLRENPQSGRDYSQACAVLARAGLNPDNGYSYGANWLVEEVPSDVIAFLESLPEATSKPAWI